jgi:DmsE family decaheme c-type cytochrome
VNHAYRGLPRRAARGTLHRSVLAVFAALAVAGAGAAQAQPGDAAGSLWGTASVDSLAATAAYVGIAQCVECHDTIADKFEPNPHHGAHVDSHPAGTTVQCESCHGPGSLHVEAAGDEKDPKFYAIRSFHHMKPADEAAVCRACHVNGEQVHWDQSAHARNDVPCQACHSIHDAKSEGGKFLLREARATQLCVTCHSDKRTELAHTAHMPLREGGMDCSDCHNPHGSTGPHMIRGVSNNELCTKCHMDKRGPMLWEHPPVRENCVTCHRPHGSNNDKVLASKRPFLCQQCHIASRHPSTLYDRPDLQSNRLFNRSCTNCHTQIHGSNHPSGKTFLR